MTQLSHQRYSAGHPWYYFLGGAVPKLKDIRDSILSDNYEGYLAADIKAIGRRSEPQRTRAIHAMRSKLIADLKRDVSIYRRCVRELRKYRRNHPAPNGACCADIHTSMSLKHNHIYNGFANLKTLDGLPAQQLDLFGR
ncbi:hypothetical protein [Roseobacter litoralis]|uniref:Uncharacterized protein n=1 Tax=Roseobacter litoralis (strain ATCC 49566 / DSM 6996 / JCM 21268 / NBRC 15278 / OCh 149) TaxID=391595 RepID=F7ZBQ2_ROSLO|nr:hypothetical protein [Roseobacter litoralis]AEI93094.1 hypothetical protein RLO149_c010870 [Roseobacter litoralis Och 149]